MLFNLCLLEIGSFCCSFPAWRCGACLLQSEWNFYSPFPQRVFWGACRSSSLPPLAPWKSQASPPPWETSQGQGGGLQSCSWTPGALSSEKEIILQNTSSHPKIVRHASVRVRTAVAVPQPSALTFLLISTPALAVKGWSGFIYRAQVSDHVLLLLGPGKRAGSLMKMPG